MDGLLLDTEPLWGESMYEVVEKHGLNIRQDLFKHTQGFRIYEVTAFWKERFSWRSGVSSEALAEEILDNIIERAKRKGSLMPGVLQTLDLLKRNDIPLGVATSSPERMTMNLLRHFNITEYFDYIATADKVKYGKPHPDVYLFCAENLQTDSWQCLAFEDSLNGLIAAKAARMKTVIVPENFENKTDKFSIANLILPSLEHFNYKHWLDIAES